MTNNTEMELIIVDVNQINSLKFLGQVRHANLKD